MSMFQFMNRLRFRRSSDYETLGDELNFEIAVVQAARLLDEAAQLSIKRNDVGGMIEVAEAWLNLGAGLVIEEEEEESEEEDELADCPDSFSVIGFSSSDDRDVKERAYYDGKSNSRNGIHQKHAGL